MGYETRYRLDAVEPIELREALLAAPSSEYDTIAKVWSGFGGHCKWYELEDDIAEAMKLLPLVSVTITGQGDDIDDRWTRRWSRVDGEVVCEVTRLL